jgi:hypothetical protein
MVKIREKRGWVRIVAEVLFGMVLPVFCVVVDPIVFRSSGFGQAVLRDYSLMRDLAMGSAIVLLCLWIFLERCPALFGGLLLGCALNAFLLGIAILPITFLGLFVGIGFLGLLPFLAGYVFLRNAVEAFAMSRQEHGRDVWLSPIVGLILAVGVPAGTQWFIHGQVTSAIDSLFSANKEEVADSIATLKKFHFVVDFDQLVLAYEAEKDADRRASLAAAYRELTGMEIERRLHLLRD